MRKFIINTATGNIKFETLIDYNLSEGETLVETDDLSTLVFPEVEIEVPQGISDIQFISQLEILGIKEKSILTYLATDIKARVTFSRNSSFEINSFIVELLCTHYNLNKNELFINASKI